MNLALTVNPKHFTVHQLYTFAQAMWIKPLTLMLLMLYSTCHGSWVPGPVLTVSCLYACAYVWAGVCGCVWLRLIRSSWELSPLGYISSCHALPLVRSLQFAVDVYEAFLVPGFRDSWALLLSWTPIAGDSSAHCFPALPASAPTESSVSAYGKLRFCLRKAPRLPTEAPPLCLRKLRLVSRCVLLLVINSLFPQLNPPVFIVTQPADLEWNGLLISW